MLRDERGNVFFALFGAVALVGVMGVSLMTFMKGPLKSAVTVQRVTQAENRMMAAAQLSVMTASSQTNNGDCDADGFVEPLEYRSAGTAAHPTGGGYIPNEIGATKTDPWGTEYGYCVWNMGSVAAVVPNGGSVAACDAASSGTERRLAGVNDDKWPVLAIISAGPDQQFQTDCNAWADANADNNPDTALVDKPGSSDDIVFTHTYGEAIGASGGLWRLKTGSPDTAVITKNLEITGGATVSGALELTGGGLLLPDQLNSGACSVANDQQLRRNTSTTPPTLEICDHSGGGGWAAVSGGGNGTQSFSDDNSVACDGTTIGQVRYNATSQLPEFCDGTDWRPFTINMPTVNLVLTPVQQNAMDVDGGVACGGQPTCYGSTVTFTLQNQGSQTSAAINVALTNTTNFEFVSAPPQCQGMTLGPNQSCSILVRAKATGNLSYTGNLTITANNNPFATLQGTSSGFGCFPGRQGGGGVYVFCGYNDGLATFDLVATPGGCTAGTINPTCAGGTDTLSLQQSSAGTGTPFAADASSGALNSVVKLALEDVGYGGTFPAVDQCMALEYAGYTDWYLPAANELIKLYQNKAAVGGVVNAHYWSSAAAGATWGTFVDMSNGVSGGNTATGTKLVRCFRRHGATPTLPPVTADTTPDAVTFPFKVAYSSGVAGRTTSDPVTIAGILQPITVAVSGPGNPMLTVNGGAEAASIPGVRWGDQVRVVMDAPTTTGTKNTATVTLGGETATWNLGYADSSRVATVFVTSAGYNAHLGGVSGANAKCASSASAAGYGGTWSAIISSNTSNAKENMPWNWGQARLVNGTVVANGYLDFWDGSIQNPINRDENGASRTTNVWTGVHSTYVTTGANTGNSCNPGWTTADPTWSGYVGSTGVSGAGWLGYGSNNCGTLLGLYCISDPGGAADTNPVDVSFPLKVTYTSGERVASNTVTVGGITTTISVSVSGAAGNPKMKINGGSEVTSGTASLGDTIQIVMDAPTTTGTKNTATVTLGDDTAAYSVGYADSAREARIFVSSTEYAANGISGFAGGDSKCSSLASAAGFGGTWKALLSNHSAADGLFAASRMPWNWGTLKRIDGAIVASSWADLWDGSIQNPINVTELGTTLVSGAVLTNTDSTGNSYSLKYSVGTSCNDWGGAPSGEAIRFGGVTNSNSSWVSLGNGTCGNGYQGHIYCVEDTPAGDDLTPNSFSFTYSIFQPVSTRISSNIVTITGITATANVVLTGAQGNPAFKINGGAEVTSGTISNGQTLQLVMDSPASFNQSNKVEVKVGNGSNVPWRVWTGDISSTTVKRVFVTSTAYSGNLGGVGGADTKCQSQASGAGLTGTWKAIISGSAEPEWAINRIGYDWGTLKLVDGSTVVTTTPNIWNQNTNPLQSGIRKDQNGADVGTQSVRTGTDSAGLMGATNSSNCWDWTDGSSTIVASSGTTTATAAGWVDTGALSCYGTYGRLYCIEQ